MWEQISSNRQKSAVLVALMAALLIGLGYVIAETYASGAGVVGIVIAFVIWLILSLAAYFEGDSILLAVTGAKRIEKDDHPQLFNVVEEMTIASGSGKMPAVYLMNDMALNAFAAGRKPENASVAVTAGLLGALNRDELQGVVGHEMAHIKNRDVLLMSMAGIMLGAIVMVSEIFLRSLWHGGGRGARRYSGKNEGQAAAIMAVIGIVLAILAPLFAQLIYFAISRKREFLADACSAQFTRYPEGLASALEKIGGSHHRLASATKATAPMFIANPFLKANASAWTATHPPLADRVKILRRIGGNVSYAAYQQAWQNVEGREAGQLPKSALHDKAAPPVREPNAEQVSPRERLREAGDALRKLNQFVFLPCICGLRVKLPPGHAADSIQCPRCQRTLTVPVAVEALTQIGQAATGPPPHTTRKTVVAAPLKIKRNPGAWMTFTCSCGAKNSISPAFSAPRMECATCKRTIEVE